MEQEKVDILMWSQNRSRIFVDVLTTGFSVRAAGGGLDLLVDRTDRLARICCDLGVPHIVIGEKLQSLDLAGRPLMAPAAPISAATASDAQENFTKAWEVGMSCTWFSAWDTFTNQRVPDEVLALLRIRTVEAFLYGAGDPVRFARIATDIERLASKVFLIQDVVLPQIASASALRKINFHDVESSYKVWCGLTRR
jgi:hypothetical protein